MFTEDSKFDLAEYNSTKSAKLHEKFPLTFTGDLKSALVEYGPTKSAKL